MTLYAFTENIEGNDKLHNIPVINTNFWSIQ